MLQNYHEHPNVLLVCNLIKKKRKLNGGPSVKLKISDLHSTIAVRKFVIFTVQFGYTVFAYSWISTERLSAQYPSHCILIV